MAKPKRKRKLVGDAAPTPTPSTPATPAAYWFAFDVSWAKICASRIIIFGLLALDALLQIRHAPRYGAGGFNVAQLRIFEPIAPGRAAYTIGQLLDAYLLVLAAFGVATRIVVPLAAAIYAWLYFGSQLDSYQHHYLMALVLALASFVPWQRPANDRTTRAATRVKTWALRLILWQLAILYIWAAVSKMTPAWLDGRTLSTQIGGSLRAVIDHTIGIAWTSKLVLVTELTLAALVPWPRAWPIAAPLGIGFHFGIVLTGLEIGLFAWLMIGIYALVLPDRIWVAIGAHLPVPARAIAWITTRARGGGAALVLGAAAIMCAIACRLPLATIVGAIVVVASLAAAWLAPLRTSRGYTAAAIAAAMALWLAVDRGSTVTTDYYRLWGNAARAMDDLAGAEQAYRGLVDIAPDDPDAHVKLGRVLVDRGDPAAGRAEVRTALILDPSLAQRFGSAGSAGSAGSDAR